MLQTEWELDQETDQALECKQRQKLLIFPRGWTELDQIHRKLVIENLALPRLLRKEVTRKSGTKQQDAYESRKEDMANETVSNHYDPEVHVIILTDTSTESLEATLWQMDKTGRGAVTFASRPLCRAAITRELERE